MKKAASLTLVIFLFFKIAFCQTNFTYEKIVPLKSIELKLVDDPFIKYFSNENELIFSKKTTLVILDRILKDLKTEIDSSNNIQEWFFEIYENHKKSYEFIEKNESLTLPSIWENDTVTWEKQFMESELFVTTTVIHRIACEMLDSGNVIINRNGKTITKILKAKVTEGNDYFETTSIKYLLNDSSVILRCFPITHADFF